MKLDFKTLRHNFWAHKYRSTMQQKLFQFFLQQEAAAFGNNIGKEPVKATLTIEKYVYYIFTENICSARNPMQVAGFCKHVLISKNSN